MTAATTATPSARKRKRVCRSRPTNRKRRTGDQIAAIKAEIVERLEADRPMTVRQLYYQLVSGAVIEKTEAEYKTVVRLLGTMRRSGDIPFSWIADNIRWMRKPDTYSSLQDMLADSTEFYRRQLWKNQDAYVEVWLEKDALSGVLYEVTGKWDVPLMVTRGYPSLSFVHAAAENIEAIDKPTFIYYFGDHDPSGVDIPRVVRERLGEFAPFAEIEFKCVAVTLGQIEAWDLPTRPTKQADSRAKNFEGESVEVDAIPAARLRELAEECIQQHIDEDLLARTEAVEAAGRKTLVGFLESLEGVA